MHVSKKINWEPAGDRTDKIGRVIIRVILADPKGGNLKGNITRTFSVHGATVTEVAQITRGACQSIADKAADSMRRERAGNSGYTGFSDDVDSPGRW